MWRSKGRFIGDWKADGRPDLEKLLPGLILAVKLGGTETCEQFLPASINES